MILSSTVRSNLCFVGNLLGSLALLPSAARENVKINCDSLTVDIIELFAIQNLPYLTFFLRPPTDSRSDSLTSHPLYEFILNGPSIGFLTVWSISQRCSHEDILYHLTHAQNLSNQFLQRLPRLKGLRLVNADDKESGFTYQRIATGDVTERVLPKLVVVFRFEPTDLPQVTFRLSRSTLPFSSPRSTIWTNSTLTSICSTSGCSRNSRKDIEN